MCTGVVCGYRSTGVEQGIWCNLVLKEIRSSTGIQM